MFRLFIALAVAFSALLSTPPPAQAFELLGRCLWGDCPNATEKALADGILDPTSFSVTVNVAPGQSGQSDDLGKIVKGASELWNDRSTPASGSAGLLNKAQGDYRNILAALYNDGRYGGSISITWQGQEVSDLPLTTKLPDGAEILVSVTPSEQYRFGRASVENAPSTSADGERFGVRLEREGYASGAVARASSANKAERLAVDGWRAQGYAKARIEDRQFAARHPERELDATIVAAPGRLARYGETTVTGTQRMNAAFVARQAALKPGDIYDPEDFKRARARLQRLGVFDSQRFVEADEIGANGILPLTLQVKERKLRRFGVGATVSTIDGLSAEAFWLHRNLWGRAERLRFDGRVSGVGTTFDPTKLDYLFSTELVLPGRFHPDLDLTLRTFAEREVLDTYTATKAETSIGADYFATETWTLDGRAFANYGRYNDAYGIRNFGIVGVEGGVEFDSRDNKLDATKGFLATAELAPFYEWQFGNFAVKAEGEGRAFAGLGEDARTVLAGRLKLGAIAGAPLSQLPSDTTFLAGGGASVRGFAYRSIGVSGPGNQTVGGRSVLEASAEIRQGVTENIGLVGFVDVGTVGTGAFPNFNDNLRVGAGLGLRYKTGLGPIRLDVALPVVRKSGDSRFGIYAGIGQAF
ncbi:MAG: autotransporter assembly complex family protein [Pseudomonadota bacterium]